MLVDHLRPDGRLGVCEEPARVVLSLDYEDAAVGDQDVVYLSGPIAERQGDVVEEMVGSSWELAGKGTPNRTLSLVLGLELTLPGQDKPQPKADTEE
jgi:hypothetical protein